MSGVTDATLYDVGKVLLRRDRFMMFVMAGRRVSTQALSKVVGMGSKQLDFEFPLLIIFLTSSSVTGWNDDSE